MQHRNSGKPKKPFHSPSARPSSARRPSPFPSGWTWFFDTAVPSWVKNEYSPKESWKNKPFGPVDAHFFFRGIDELSELFTQERPRNLPNYFQHPKYRSAYLLYYLPLQAAKFITLYQTHGEAILKALNEALDQNRNEPLDVADLGAGPGTASLALVLWLLDAVKAGPFPLIRFHWWDTNGPILEDGRSLLKALEEHFPKLKGRVSVECHRGPWVDAAAKLPDNGNLFVILGHVLNESPMRDIEGLLRSLAPLFQKSRRGPGILMVEPAAHRPAQLLSQLRDLILETTLVEHAPTALWGPCLHAGRCPLSGGRDWCHFSVPTEIPGRWFKQFSRGLGSERQWVKFSYVWFASQELSAPEKPEDSRLIISDPLEKRRDVRDASYLICEPEQVTKKRLPSHHRRGETIRLAPLREPAARKGRLKRR